MSGDASCFAPGKARLRVIAGLTEPRALSESALRALPKALGGLAVRADLVGEVHADWLRDHFRGQIIYSLRSRHEGGTFEGTQGARQARLVAAALQYDLVELESERDLVPAILDRIPVERRFVSWRGQGLGRGGGPSEDMALLGAAWARISSVEAGLHALMPAAADPLAALAPLQLMEKSGARTLAAFATGPAGSFTRLLSPLLGAPVAFGSLEGGVMEGGEILARRLLWDYGLPSLTRVSTLYGIAGPHTEHSLSPLLHNAAYRALGLPALFVPFQTTRFSDLLSEPFLDGLAALGLPLGGLTVTAPFKEEALDLAGSRSAMAHSAGAANALLRRAKGWHADTTDAAGVMEPLRAHGIQIAGQLVAVVGCGGAGRAVACVLRDAGADVTLVNRGLERGHHAARLLDLPFIPLAELDVGRFALVINVTPCAGQDGHFPFAVERLRPGAAMLDFVYGENAATPLVERASARGRHAISGREVLLVEASLQLHLMTGHHMPEDGARALLRTNGGTNGETGGGAQALCT